MGTESGTLVVDVVVGVACNFVSRVALEDVSATEGWLFNIGVVGIVAGASVPR